MEIFGDNFGENMYHEAGKSQPKWKDCVQQTSEHFLTGATKEYNSAERR
jgi:hypothetical protein